MYKKLSSKNSLGFFRFSSYTYSIDACSTYLAYVRTYYSLGVWGKTTQTCACIGIGTNTKTFPNQRVSHKKKRRWRGSTPSNLAAITWATGSFNVFCTNTTYAAAAQCSGLFFQQFGGKNVKSYWVFYVLPWFHKFYIWFSTITTGSFNAFWTNTPYAATQ